VTSTRNPWDEKPTKAELDQQLDDALKQTFPASDPISVGQPTGFIPDRPVEKGSDGQRGEVVG
jgi:hypothetical protein